jgi:hypothetical protein
VGNIRVQEKTKQTVIFTVGSIKDLTNVIIPHFVNYPLLTKKTPDFELFKKVLDSSPAGPSPAYLQGRAGEE